MARKCKLRNIQIASKGDSGGQTLSTRCKRHVYAMILVIKNKKGLRHIILLQLTHEENRYKCSRTPESSLFTVLSYSLNPLAHSWCS